MKEFHLEVVTPDGLSFEGMIESLLVHSLDGDVEFLAGHIDYVAALGTGRARIRIGGKDRFAAVSGGFVTVSGGSARLVAITFEFAEDIDLDRARLARDRAKETISLSSDTRALDVARAKLQRAICRINVAEL